MLPLSIDVRGHSEYRISPSGFVFSKRNGIILSSNKTRDGYIYVDLYTNGTKKRYSIHRLVAMGFLENDFKLPCVNHLDGDKANNNACNLEWCSYSRNNKHAFEKGLNKRILGSENKSSKLNEDQVREIRLLYSKNKPKRKFGPVEFSQEKLAKMFNVKRPTIQDIINRKTWSHLE